MTPLEQQVREALTDEVLDDAFSEALVMCSDTEPSTTLRHYILTALRPLLERQAALAAELQTSRETNTRLNRRVIQAEAANSVTVEDCRRQGVPFGRSLANAECNRLTALVATLTAELDEARGIAVDFLGRMESQSRYVDSGDPARKKIAAWSGETR